MVADTQPKPFVYQSKAETLKLIQHLLVLLQSNRTFVTSLDNSVLASSQLKRRLQTQK